MDEARPITRPGIKMLVEFPEGTQVFGFVEGAAVFVLPDQRAYMMDLETREVTEITPA